MMSSRVFTSCLYLFNLSTILFLYLQIVYSLTDSGSQETQGGLSIPLDAKNRPVVPNRVQPQGEEVEIKYGDYPENRCFCSYGHEEGVCDRNETCIKHPLAACFHAVEMIYNETMKSMVTWHKYGCAPLEKGSDASHLTCHQHKAAHFRPKSIGCCYEGNYCNLHVEPPPYAHISEDFEDYEFGETTVFGTSVYKAVLISGLISVFLLIGICFMTRFYQRKKKEKILEESLMEKQPMLGIDDSGSGSGSGMCSLSQRTVAQDLKIIEMIDQGRYGKVRKAEYRGGFVAVKTFNTTEEESWKNERDVYQTQMLNHESILQFVAADINSEDSITQMLLITDYHELGSLYDYLRREEKPLGLKEALQLAHSSISGIDHLHNSVLGTGSRRKPEIAHRDLKSKNIIVKRPGCCCIADFGLAVRVEDGKIIPEKLNIQVGTKRYMAPEVLSKELKINDFEQFKRADIYSFALVMWEIARKVQCLNVPKSEEQSDQTDSGIGSGSSSNSWSRPYEPPFEGLVKHDPSFEEMKIIVCDKNYRPPIEPMWRDSSNPQLSSYVALIIDCWNSNPHRRHSALRVKKELRKILESLAQVSEDIDYIGLPTQLHGPTHKKDSDSGIGSNSKEESKGLLTPQRSLIIHQDV